MHKHEPNRPDLVVWPEVTNAFAGLWSIPGEGDYVALELRFGRADPRAHCYLFPATADSLDLFRTLAEGLAEHLARAN